jgi:Na+-transporting methylmalonyl-CoA/oxaloacetate decarboxylase gamma subunit
VEEEKQIRQSVETTAAPVAEGSGAFRWNPAVGVMIFIVLLMLALPMGMIGWHLRGWQQERAQPVEQSNAESEAEGVELRLALEAAAEGWRPKTELGFPAVMIKVEAGDFARVNELISREMGGLTLIDFSENEATYWGELNQEGLEELRKNLEEKNLINPKSILAENIDDEQVTTRITIKAEK